MTYAGWERAPREVREADKRGRKMAKTTFPKIIYVRTCDEQADDDENLLAWRREEHAVEGDGPTVVAEYKLVGTRRLKKGVQEIPR